MSPAAYLLGTSGIPPAGMSRQPLPVAIPENSAPACPATSVLASSPCRGCREVSHYSQRAGPLTGRARGARSPTRRPARDRFRRDPDRARNVHRRQSSSGRDFPVRLKAVGMPCGRASNFSGLTVVGRISDPVRPSSRRTRPSCHGDRGSLDLEWFLK